jgi:hypothetical protein
MRLRTLLFITVLSGVVLMPLIAYGAVEHTGVLGMSTDLTTCLFGSPGDKSLLHPELWDVAPGSCSIDSIFALANNLITWMAAVSGAVALLMFIIGGVWMIFSGGNSSRIERGKDILIGTSISLIFILGGWILVNFILTSLTSWTLLNQAPAARSMQTPPAYQPTDKKNYPGCCVVFTQGDTYPCQLTPNATEDQCIQQCENKLDPKKNGVNGQGHCQGIEFNISDDRTCTTQAKIYKDQGTECYKFNF